MESLIFGYRHKKRESPAASLVFFVLVQPLTTAGKKMNNTPKLGRDTIGINFPEEKIFAGTYNRLGAKLTHQEEPTIRLVIGTRLNPTKKKPKHFLLLMVGRSKSAIYFSSMYQTDNPNVFEVEHEKVKYILHMDTDKAELLLSNQSVQAA